jgi:hypothetical protein
MALYSFSTCDKIVIVYGKATIKKYAPVGRHTGDPTCVPTGVQLAPFMLLYLLSFYLLKNE